ncbi:transcription intermediary factor 1-alpha-like [Mizuhopecten yessoensis]|uniref:Tripartite motif-containing protein 55 n=1 Tax=Mizuhopecten yessoensis TaxID=6573 RepID=A0A210QQQ1_MIZYE|nr:transcription intermediary factor 1-alpha-like [Mizuhopecten yessoensis]OWF51060.1 Tripartite motif-containing protein 55 [Mizuhopecten yessoensis]
MEGELTCGICLEFFDNPLMLPCSHNFCKKCLEGIINARQGYRLRRGPGVNIDCPLCQRHWSLDNGLEGLPGNLTLDNIISHYKSKGAVPYSEASWNSDLDITEVICKMHDEPMIFYCLTCDSAVCKECACCIEKGSKTSHRCTQIKEHASNLQATISSKLTEVKKKVIPLNDRIQVLEDIIRGIDANQQKVEKQLVLEISSLVSLLNSRQEELTRLLGNDILDIRRPVEDHLRRYKNLQTTIQEHFKKLSMVKGTKDVSLRIKLMQDSEKQLNSLLCFDLAWFSSNDMPAVDMPSWLLQKHNIEQKISEFKWQKKGGDGTRPLMPLVPLQMPVLSQSEPMSMGFGSRCSSAERDSPELIKTPIVSGFDSGFKVARGPQDAGKKFSPEIAKLPVAPGLDSFLQQTSEASSSPFALPQCSTNSRTDTSGTSMSFSVPKSRRSDGSVDVSFPAGGGTKLFSLSLSGKGGPPNVVRAPTSVTMTTQKPVSTTQTAIPAKPMGASSTFKFESVTDPSGAASAATSGARQGHTGRKYPTLTTSDFIPRKTVSGKSSFVMAQEQPMEIVSESSSMASSISVSVNSDGPGNVSTVTSGLDKLSLSDAQTALPSVPVISPSINQNTPLEVKFPVFPGNPNPSNSSSGNVSSGAISFRVSLGQSLPPYSPPTVSMTEQSASLTRSSNDNFNTQSNIPMKGDNSSRQIACGASGSKTESPSVTTLTFGVKPKTSSGFIFPSNQNLLKPVVSAATMTTTSVTSAVPVSQSATYNAAPGVSVSLNSSNHTTRRASAPVVTIARGKSEEETRSATDGGTSNFGDGLPKLSSRDFSPSRTGSPPRPVTYRRIVKPKTKLPRK